MKVNVGGVWKDSIPKVNVAGSWVAAQHAWVNVNGSWEKFYSKVYTYTISSNKTDFNLHSAIGIPVEDIINVVVDPNVTINASSVNAIAFNIGNAYSGKTINLINKGAINGRGGTGGAKGVATGNQNGSAGSAGGTALYTRTSNLLNITNTGSISGGGGGGGGGGGIQATFDGGGSNPDITVNHSGGDGASGAEGSASGPNGPSGQLYNVGSGQVYKSAGGNGGSAGQAGQAGGNPWATGEISKSQGVGGAGGRGGYSIDGGSHATFITYGTVRGSQVN
jgi:hypothetical protein